MWNPFAWLRDLTREGDMESRRRHNCNILREFGFKLALGTHIETVSYRDILDVRLDNTPGAGDDDLVVTYRNHAELRSTVIRVIRVDIARDVRGNILDDVWHFVYYREIVDFYHDGTRRVRELQESR